MLRLKLTCIDNGPMMANMDLVLFMWPERLPNSEKMGTVLCGAQPDNNFKVQESLDEIEELLKRFPNDGR